MGTHELEDDVASDDNEAGADSSEEERYPPWLHQIVEGEYYNIVRIVKEEGEIIGVRRDPHRGPAAVRLVLVHAHNSQPA